MSEILDQIVKITEGVRALKQENERLKNVIGEQEVSISQMTSDLMESSQKMNQLEVELVQVKNERSVQSIDTVEIKAKIDELVKEIDGCLELIAK